MSTPSTPITGSLLVRNHHKKRELNGGKYSSTETMSSEFLSKFVDWRNSRFKALPENRKCDRWYQALLNNGVWQQWFLDGLVQSDRIANRILCTRYPSLAPHEHPSHSIKLFYFVWIYVFCLPQLRGRRQLTRSARRKICSTPSTATLHRQAQSRELRGQTS